MATIGSSTMPPQVRDWFCDVLLSTPTPNLIYDFACQEISIPANKGDTVVRSRYNRITQLALTPIDSNGNIPNSLDISRIDIRAKVNFYGGWIESTEDVVLHVEDAFLNKSVELLGINLRETEDKLMQDAILTSASTYYFQFGNNGDDPTNWSFPDVLNVAQQLEMNSAIKIIDKQQGELRFATAPVYSAFIALGHTALRTDMLADRANFLPKWNYANSQETVSSELGSCADFRFFISPVAPVSATSSAMGRTIYYLSMMGMESTMKVLQDRFSSHIVYRDPKIVDPLGFKWTLSYISCLGQSLIQDLWCVNALLTV